MTTGYSSAHNASTPLALSRQVMNAYVTSASSGRFRSPALSHAPQFLVLPPVSVAALEGVRRDGIGTHVFRMKEPDRPAGISAGEAITLETCHGMIRLDSVGISRQEINFLAFFAGDPHMDRHNTGNCTP